MTLGLGKIDKLHTVNGMHLAQTLKYRHTGHAMIIFGVICGHFNITQINKGESQAGTATRTTTKTQPVKDGTANSSTIAPNAITNTQCTLSADPLKVKGPSPVNPDRLSHLLKGYGDYNYLTDGFNNGFKLDFQGPEHAFSGTNSNAAFSNPAKVQKKIDQEISIGRIVGPFDEMPLKHFKSSPLSLREKSAPGKYRLLQGYSTGNI